MKATKIIVTAILYILFHACDNKEIQTLDLIPVKNGETYQYIDREGKIVINPQFENATVFRDGLALVQTSGEDGKWGYIDKDGKFIIEPQYKYATVFCEDLAWVVAENEAPMVINRKGEKIFSLSEAERVAVFNDGLAAFSVINESGEISWGFVDKNGEVRIVPQFRSVHKFSEGLSPVANSDFKWGYIDKKGKIVINYQFDYAYPFKNGKAVVELGDKFGAIDKSGKYIINPQFEGMESDKFGYMILQNDKIGWCDKEGKIVINPQFEGALLFNGNNLAPVLIGKMYGFIDKEGKIVIPAQFDYAMPFNGGLGMVVMSDKIGFIDKNGKYVINPQFDAIATDAEHYMSSGSSRYTSVETDYFNVNTIVSTLHFDAPNGFTINSTYGDIMDKLNLKKSVFNRYGNENIVIVSKPINRDADYSLSVIGTPFKKTTVVKQGWFSNYTTTEYQFDPTAKPLAFTYTIRLSNNGIGKEEMLTDAFENKLKASGYGKTEGETGGIQYQSEMQDVGIYRQQDEVTVKIKFHSINQ